MKNVVFVCTGNTCRSPMAEGYLKSIKPKGYEIISRGLATDGSPAANNSVAVMLEAGIDITKHISKHATFCSANMLLYTDVLKPMIFLICRDIVIILTNYQQGPENMAFIFHRKMYSTINAVMWII